MSPAASFYFDLGSPESYLAAERILHVLPGPAEWRPLPASELPGGGAPRAFRCGEEEEIFFAQIARRAEQLGLQPLRRPDPFPFDSTLAMRVASYARSIGRAVPFALAAFRQAFAGGHSLAERDHVLIAAAACEMHPAAVLAAAQLRSVDRELRSATDEALRADVREVPAVVLDGHTFQGELAVEEAAAHARRALRP